jgi:hypothetical protein
MERKIILTAILAIAALPIFGQASKSKKVDASIHTAYTCTMHPEVESDKPGKCPKCGMDLVEKKNDKQPKDPGLQKMPMRKKDSTMTKQKLTSNELD